MDTENCDQSVTPNCLRELYGFNYTFIDTQRNKVGVGEDTICRFDSCLLWFTHPLRMQWSLRIRHMSPEIWISSSRSSLLTW